MGATTERARHHRRQRTLIRAIAVYDLELRSIDEGDLGGRDTANTGQPAFDFVAHAMDRESQLAPNGITQDRIPDSEARVHRIGG